MNATVNTTFALAGYRLVEQLYSSARTAVYRGIRLVDDQIVVVKLLQQEYPTFHDLLQFRNQYAIMLRIADANVKNLNFPGIIRPYSLESYRNSYALVMEDFGGVSLRDYTCDRRLAIAQVLEIALQVADILHDLHQNRVIHKDIKPANILIHPKTKQVKLIDFSIASLLPKETQEIKNPNILEGTLAYLAPEQTGRMNRGIDYRSDFYALGVTLFELLAGELPFKSDDAMELVHCHIAKQPPDLTQFNIPKVLANIVAKLMAKNAEYRYQTALGLKYDLEICLDQLKETGKIDAFEIGQRDASDRFLIPEKLYGRENDVQTLLEAFDRVANGTSEMMLVAGFSGIGKTAVVNEVHKPITRQQGYFIKGKFDQFNRNIPFSAFVQALRGLMGQLLSESDAQLAQWKTKILAAVGDNGQVLIEVIPELERLIDKQSPVPELSGTAAQNRFNLLFQKFIAVFTTKEHPLVMFLDDLQWADSASLQLIKLLMEDTSYLLFLGAYRDNEVSPAHPFILTLDELKKTGKTINTITLCPLAFQDTNQLVAETLKCSIENAQPLTELIARKTQGNPFFTTQFLKALHEDEYITFNRGKGYWECDLTQVNALSLTDDVVEFMATQLQKLPAQTQKILQLAACVGNQFDLETLAIVSERSPSDTADALWKGLQEGLILPQSEVYKFYLSDDGASENTGNRENVAYRFLHDRVQQAAYSLIPNNQKQRTHLKIGQLLLSNASDTEQKEKIFDIVNHLNLGIELVTDEAQRSQLATLNLEAGRKALVSTAHAAAAKYFETGMQLLANDSWKREYNLTLSLYESAVEAEYLNGNFTQAQTLIDLVLQQTANILDRVKVFELQIQIYMAQTEMAKAVSVGISILGLVGIDLDLAPRSQDIQLPTPAEIESLPTMTDAYSLAAMRILMAIHSSVFVIQPELLPQIVLMMIDLSLKQGHTSITACAYELYGLLLCGLERNIDRGYQAGLLGLKVLERFPARELECRVRNTFNVFIHHWKQPLINTAKSLAIGSQIGFETGDLEYASYSTTHSCTHYFFAGLILEEVEKKQRLALENLLHSKQDYSIYDAKIWQQVVANLLGKTTDTCQLQGENFDETELLPVFHANNNGTLLFTVYLAKAMLGYLFDKYEIAIANAESASNYLDAVVGFATVTIHNFYYSLILLAECDRIADREENQQPLLDRVAANQVLMSHWMAHAPANFAHKYYLIEAEKARVLNHKAVAIDLYDRAIAKAKENGYIQEEALANELAAKFYLNWCKEKCAASYMQEAYYCYAKWGAKAKVEELENRYPQLLYLIRPQTAPTLNPLETLAFIPASNVSIYASKTDASSSSSSINNLLDFISIIKVSQALSSTIQLEELLCQLTQIILQNSGGDRCTLIMPNLNQSWQVRAIATPESTRLCSELLENNPDLPVKLIQYVKNTQSLVVIDDLKTDLPVICEYLNQQQPQSVLCLPILNQAQLRGILYLENRATRGVFTSDRIFVLNFLCTQAAISLENAKLHAQEQEKSYHLEQSQRRLKLLLQQTPVAVMEWNTNFELQFWNPAAEKVFGYCAEEVLGQNSRCIIPQEYHAYVDDVVTEILAQSGGTHAINENITKDGRRIICEWFNAPMFNANGEVSGGVSMCLDITERQTAEVALQQKSQALEKALQELQKAQLQIVQSEKMSALGNLVAGVAHEINNPVGCILGNVSAAQDYINDLLGIIALYQETFTQPGAAIEDELEAIDLDYVREDLPKLIKAMKDGGDRIKSISQSLRTFSRADSDTKQPFNLHEGIDSTLLILRHRLKANEYRPAIKVVTQYGQLPEIACFPGQLNQVFMNILANGIDALDETNQGRSFAEIEAKPNQITVRTMVEGEAVKIAIADNGSGIPEQVKTRIFDHLFTTKGVGKGTGLGLAIARQIIVEKHGGTIEVNSTLGQGAEFVISLPVE